MITLRHTCFACRALRSRSERCARTGLPALWRSRHLCSAGWVMARGTSAGMRSTPTSEALRDYHYGVTSQALAALRIVMMDRIMLDGTARGYYVSGLGSDDTHGSEALFRGDAGSSCVSSVANRSARGLQPRSASRITALSRTGSSTSRRGRSLIQVRWQRAVQRWEVAVSSLSQPDAATAWEKPPDHDVARTVRLLACTLSVVYARRAGARPSAAGMKDTGGSYRRSDGLPHSARRTLQCST